MSKRLTSLSMFSVPNRTWVLAAVLLLAVGTAYSQTTYATITGTVTDVSGAVVLNAAVTATNLERNVTSTAVSNETGAYTLAQLIEGSYVVRVQATGFREFTAKDIQLASRDVRRLDVMLDIAAAATSIEVSGGGAALIETENARVSDVKTADTMKMMPLNARWLWAFFEQVPNMQAGWNGYRFGGSTGNQANWMIDGTTMTDAFGWAIGPQLNYMESYQAVGVEVAGTSAEFGGIGQVIVTTKSGTNQLHGSVFDTFYTPGLRARNFFATDVWSARYHILGGGLGGPVVIPKLYNGRNKTFFYGSFERSAGSAQVNQMNPGVPIQAWRDGDFSGLLPGTVIYDPLNKQPFAGNRLPASRMSAVSRQIQERYYPLPNFGNPNVFETANYRETKERPWVSPYMATARVDQHFSATDFMFARVTWTHSPVNDWQGNLPTIGRLDGRRISRSATGSYTHVFTANVFNEFRYGMDYNNSPRRGPVNGQEEAQRLGLVGLAPGLGDFPGMLNVTWQGIGLQDIGQWNGSDPGWRNHNEHFQNHLSWLRGRHSLKFGTDVARVGFSQMEFPSDLFGRVTFSSRFTSGGRDGQGHPYADFLLGIPTESSRSFAPLLIDMTRWQYAAYAQDTIKVNQKLTLTLGLRYQLHTPWTEKQGRMAMFDIGTGGLVVPDKGMSQVSPLFPTSFVGIVPASKAGLPANTMLRRDWNDFGPHVGIAWLPFARSTTVLRAGYSIKYDLVPFDAMTLGTPFLLQEQPFNNPEDRPQVIFPRVFPERTGGTVNEVSLPDAINPGLRTPWTQQVNFGIEHQRWNNGFSLSYISTGQRQGSYRYNYNSPVPDERLYIDKPRPFPNYGAIGYRTNGAGHQYHGLTAKVNRLDYKGLFYQLAWTWQRDIYDLFSSDYAENPFDRRREVAVAPDIPTHRVTSSWRYELPFGKGKPLASNASRLGNLLVGGWALASTFGFHSGNFLTPFWEGPDPTGTVHTTSSTRATTTRRADQLRNPNLASGEQSIQRWFDVSAFGAPPIGRYGTSAKGVIKGPSSTMLNGGLYKTLTFGERAPRVMMEVTFRNILNHPNWSNPGTTISDVGGVGRITAAGGQGGDYEERQGRLGLRIEW